MKYEYFSSKFSLTVIPSRPGWISGRLSGLLDFFLPPLVPVVVGAQRFSSRAMLRLYQGRGERGAPPPPPTQAERSWLLSLNERSWPSSRMRESFCACVPLLLLLLLLLRFMRRLRWLSWGETGGEHGLETGLSCCAVASLSQQPFPPAVAVHWLLSLINLAAVVVAVPADVPAPRNNTASECMMSVLLLICVFLSPASSDYRVEKKTFAFTLLQKSIFGDIEFENMQRNCLGNIIYINKKTQKILCYFQKNLKIFAKQGRTSRKFAESCGKNAFFATMEKALPFQPYLWWGRMCRNRRRRSRTFPPPVYTTVSLGRSFAADTDRR